MSAIETPEQVIYLTTQAGQDAGLQAVVPVRARSKYSFFDGKRMVLDLRAVQEELHGKPGDRPVLAKNLDGTVTAVLRDEAMEAEELQDVLGMQLEKNEARNLRGQSTIDFEDMRARAGHNSAADFNDTFRESLQERIKRHRQNPITDPPRDPWATARQQLADGLLDPKDWAFLAPKVAVPELPWVRSA